MINTGIKYIEWRDEFSLGIPDVDHEHRELIELINELLEKIAGAGKSPEIMDYLGEILVKISSHFALEEKIMRESGYEEYFEHKRDHDRLLDEIREIMDRFEDSEKFDENEFATQLSLWFTEHFRTRDARFHKFFH